MKKLTAFLISVLAVICLIVPVNAYGHRITGLWKKDGDLRDRACDAVGSDDVADNQAGLLIAKVGLSDNWSNYKPSTHNLSSYSLGSGNAQSAYNYTVNVKSAGPNREYDDWDDIWSFPDDFE